MHGSATYPVALLYENSNAKHHPISVTLNNDVCRIDSILLIKVSYEQRNGYPCQASSTIYDTINSARIRCAIKFQDNMKHIKIRI